MTAEAQGQTPDPRRCALCGQELQEDQREDTDVHETCNQAFIQAEARDYAQAQARQHIEADAKAEMVRKIWGKRV